MAEVRARLDRRSDGLVDLVDLLVGLGWYVYTSSQTRRPTAPRVAVLDWRRVLGVKAGATLADADRAYRRLAMKHHPDRGGDALFMAHLNAARDAAREELR